MGLTLDEPNKDESTVQVNGLDILISDDVKSFADISTIDYVDQFFRKGFVIDREGRSGC